jgi:hypothetical protein
MTGRQTLESLPRSQGPAEPSPIVFSHAASGTVARAAPEQAGRSETANMAPSA